jgi:hypothetical protein
MTVKSTEILDQIKSEDKNLLKGKTLVRKFGRPEDCVELHVYDLNNNLLKSLYNFEGYNIPDIDNDEGYFNEITFNPDRVLRELNFFTGEYNIIVNLLRKKISNSFQSIFYIENISPSRTELRVKVKDFDNLSSLIFATKQFIAELDNTPEEVAYFKDFALNFENNIILTGVNFIEESNNTNSFLIKLYEPLPLSINEKSTFRIVEELTNPIQYKVDLGVTQIQTPSTELKGPNLRIDTRLNSSIPSAYKAYNDILKHQSTGSLNNLLNILVVDNASISIEYDNPNTTSGYTYEKFIHFSSAEERIRNFKYKLELIELYQSKSDALDSTTYPYLGIEQQNNNSLKNKVIKDFDGYERFLYFESGAYSWPKSNTTKPYNNRPVTSSEAISWFNSNIENAQDFDNQNLHILRNTLPQYIIDNNQNEQFITFVDMMGQYFDNIWLYIENITDKNNAHNSLTEGISKDSVFNALKERGIPAFDQFENANLFEYLIGAHTGSDSFVYQAPSGQTMVTGSNESITKENITKEVWKRLYHNAPYLLKTKGTERGMKALMACYGIPESILHVKEYGGPKADKSGFRTFKYPKTTKALSIKGINTEPFVEFGLFDNDVYGGRHTVEFTIIADRVGPKNIILGDAYDDTFLVFNTSSVFEEAAIPVFNHFGANQGVPPERPYFNRPVTVFLQRHPNAGVLAGYDRSISVTLATYIDNQYYEQNFTHDFSPPTGDENYYRMVMGTPGTPAANDISSSFALQHFKIYTSSLNLSTREIHTKDPSIIAGNTTSSYDSGDLLYYNPLGGNLHTETITNGYKFKDFSKNDNSNLGVTLKALKADIEYIDVTYDHYISTPDTVGSSMASEKVRYDAGTIDNNILSPVIRSEESSLDRQPQDFSNLGIFFSPTFEINEDIIYTLGGFRLDDYIGDPRHLNNDSYPDLKSLKNLYNKKVDRRYNFWEYIKLIQYFDHTLFKIIEEFAPAKANLKTGLVIEPHYLERDKFTYANTDFSNISVQDINYTGTGSISGEYILNETTIDVEQVLDGSGGSFENNFVYGRLSNKYFKISENRG